MRCGSSPPRREVVGLATDHEAVGGDPPEVDGYAEHGGVARRDELLAIDSSRKSACSSAGIRVVSAFQDEDVEGRRLLAQQVVVDPVVPDQVVGPQPGEDLGQRPRRPGSRRRRDIAIAASAAAVHHAPAVPALAWSSTVTARVERGQPVLRAGGGQVCRGHGGDDAAGAGAEAAGLVGAGDLAGPRRARRGPRARRCRGPRRRAGRRGCATRSTKTCWPWRTRYSIRLRPGARSRT